jgi:translation initiation factor IF-2
MNVVSMSDGNDNDRATLGRKPLTLTKNVGAGTVRQSFSHGRSKSVVVEMKKKRVITTPGPAAEAPARPAAPAAPAPSTAAPRPAAAPAAPTRPSAPASTGGSRTAGNLSLSADELKARQGALERARAEETLRRERERVEMEARNRRLEAERKRMEEERKAAEAEAERRRQDEERRKQLEAAIAAKKAAVDPGPATQADAGPAEEADAGQPAASEERRDLLAELGGRVKKQKVAPPRVQPVSRTKGEAKRRTGRLTVVSALGDDDDRQRSLASVKRAREKERERRLRMLRGQGADKIVREVVIPEVITVQELANRMAERVADVIKYLMREGTMAKMNDVLDPDVAELIVSDFGHTVKRVAEADVEIGLEGVADTDENVEPRAPVVTIMGHVDHGKTSLLDAIRKADVVSGEAGGITQHIGAYQVGLPGGQKVTFLDTPGHAAFSAMRGRGAKVTDIVVLVVAADDGVMPQTIEAISHARSAGVPIIVAVNKIDKHDADPNRVLTDLLQHEVITEGFGGDTLHVEVSATKKIGLEKLLETILLQSELLELRANPNRSAEGAVIEAQLDKGKGPVATVLVQKGTLKRGDIVVAGAEWGRVRALMNERGQQLAEAGPSVPVEILGLTGVPDPGDVVVVVENEQRAREVTEFRARKKREKATVAGPKSSLESMLQRIKDQETKELPVIIKADVQGSAEAIAAAVEKMSTDEIRARVLQQTVGGINESDVLLAKNTGAPLLAFNVRASKPARDLAEREGVEIRYYSIIYNLIDDVKGLMSGMLEPERKEVFLGYANILQVFQITKVGKVAGCRVTEGVVRRGMGVRLLRDDVVIHEGKLSTLKRFKDEVAEVTSGMECGMAFERYEDIREGDQIECFEIQIVQRSL